jgi:hypothetical protein
MLSFVCLLVAAFAMFGWMGIRDDVGHKQLQDYSCAKRTVYFFKNIFSYLFACFG